MNETHEFLIIVAALVLIVGLVLSSRELTERADAAFEQWCHKAGGEALDTRGGMTCVDRRVILNKEVT